jgi:peptidoglycan hydrolase CwlO-like protein
MKKRKSIIVKLTALVVFAVCAFSIVSSPVSLVYEVKASSKPTDSKVQSYEDRIAQLKKDQKAYEQQIKEAKANAESYQKQKEYLDKQIAAISEEIELSNALIIEYNNALIEKENEIANKQTEYETRMANFKSRLRTSYEEGRMGYLTMLFSSKSLSGFLTSLERMTNMLNYDKRMMKELNDQKANLSDARDSLEKIKEDPTRAATFFKDKTISQWCEPMFQSVWSGPLESCKQYTHTELLQSIYNGGEAEDRIEALSKLVLLF